MVKQHNQVESDFWEYLQDCLLYDLAEKKEAFRPELFYQSNNLDYFDFISEKGFLSALLLLEDKELVQGNHDPYAGSFYEVSSKGLAYIKSVRKVRNSIIANHENYNGWAYEAFRHMTELLGWNADDEDASQDDKKMQLPASDRTVTLKDNQVEEAAKRIEDFIQEFREDHHFGNEWAAEKSVLIEALEAGKTYIEHKVIEVRIATMMTIEPLKEIAAKYSQAAVGGTIGAMAQELIKFLIDLFKNG